jgi:hypothetical protein
MSAIESTHLHTDPGPPVVLLIEFNASAFSLNGPSRTDDEDNSKSLEMQRKGTICRHITVCGKGRRKGDGQTSRNTLDRTADSGTVKSFKFFLGNVDLHRASRKKRCGVELAR